MLRRRGDGGEKLLLVVKRTYMDAAPFGLGTVSRMLDGFPATSFASDVALEWVDMDPWTGCLADSTSPRETTPFLLGTAPVSDEEATPEGLKAKYFSELDRWAPIIKAAGEYAD